MLCDVLLRVGDLRAFYTDAGVLPRTELLAAYAQGEYPLASGFALHLGAGSTFWMGVLFAVEALAALALVFGWRSRLAAVLCFVLVSGTQLRNLYIGEGSDALLRMYLLWAALAPIGARWALDARGRPTRTEAHRDVGSLAAAVQVLVLYAATGMAKHSVDAWRTGEALSLHLDAEFFTTGFGVWLAGYPALCKALTLGTLWGELLWFVVLLVPVFAGPIRTFGVGAMMALTLGFWLGLDVDLFPLTAVVGLALFLPAWFWDRVEGPLVRVGSALSRRLQWVPAGEGIAAPALRLGRQIVAAGLLLWVVGWNVHVHRSSGELMPAGVRSVGQTLFLQQAWFMFARPATRTGWIQIHGKTVGGQTVDLFAEGGPVPRVANPETIAPSSTGRPDLPSATYANNRWRLLLKRIVYREIEGAALNYGRYICREWNDEHLGATRLETFTIRFFHRPVPQGGSEYYEELIWDHGCFR